MVCVSGARGLRWNRGLFRLRCSCRRGRAALRVEPRWNRQRREEGPRWRGLNVLLRGESISGVVYQSSCRVGLLFALGSSSSRRRFSSAVSSSGRGASRSSGLPEIGCASRSEAACRKLRVQCWAVLSICCETRNAGRCAVQRVAHHRDAPATACERESGACVLSRSSGRAA